MWLTPRKTQLALRNPWRPQKLISVCLSSPIISHHHTPHPTEGLEVCNDSKKAQVKTVRGPTLPSRSGHQHPERLKKGHLRHGPHGPRHGPLGPHGPPRSARSPRSHRRTLQPRPRSQLLQHVPHVLDSMFVRTSLTSRGSSILVRVHPGPYGFVRARPGSTVRAPPARPGSCGLVRARPRRHTPRPITHPHIHTFTEGLHRRASRPRPRSQLL